MEGADLCFANERGMNEQQRLAVVAVVVLGCWRSLQQLPAVATITTKT